VVRKCRHRRLNRAAVKTVTAIGRFAPIPAQLGTQLHIRVPIRYRLK